MALKKMSLKNNKTKKFNGDDNYWEDPCHEFETEDECSMIEGCEWFIDPSGEGVCFNDYDWWNTECFGFGYEELLLRKNETPTKSTKTIPSSN